MGLPPDRRVGLAIAFTAATILGCTAKAEQQSNNPLTSPAAHRTGTPPPEIDRQIAEHIVRDYLLRVGYLPNDSQTAKWNKVISPSLTEIPGQQNFSYTTALMEGDRNNVVFYDTVAEIKTYQAKGLLTTRLTDTILSPGENGVVLKLAKPEESQLLTLEINGGSVASLSPAELAVELVPTGAALLVLDTEQYRKGINLENLPKQEQMVIAQDALNPQDPKNKAEKEAFISTSIAQSALYILQRTLPGSEDMFSDKTLDTTAKYASANKPRGPKG